MKNLDLNGLGVQEMNAEEMVSVDGGMFMLGEWWMIYRAASPSWGWSTGGKIYA
jgi:hypothetical protein